MKQCLGIVETQQGRLAPSEIPPGEIVVVDDDRGDGIVERLLIAVAAHPRARSFAGAGKIVVQKDADMLAGAVADLPDPYIGVVDGYTGALGEADAKQAAGRVERRLHH